MNDNEIKQRLGGFNDFPPGWTEITASDFATVCVKNIIFKTEYRSMKAHYLDETVDGQLFIFSDLSGVGVTSKYRYYHTDSSYRYETKFWAFGCQHRFKEIPWEREFGVQYRGLHLRQCVNCKEKAVVDSSD